MPSTGFERERLKRKGERIMAAKKTCFGLIVGNRAFFPDELARDGYRLMKRRLKELGYNVVVLGPKDTKFGCVETWEDAKRCAALFREKAEQIDGVIVTLPNFGDERGVADSLKLSGLDVPVLVHAWNDVPEKMSLAHRRDSFCGKMSACNNLVQYGIPLSLTSEHTMDPGTDEFEDDIHWFAGVCRVVKGLRSCRVGALGARPAAFNTTRYSEKLLQESGITVETLDLSDAFGRIDALADNDAKVRRRLKRLVEYVAVDGVPQVALTKMAKLAVVVDDWMSSADLDIAAFQCWTSIEENLGIAPCAVMSMLSESLHPAACEVDVTGAVAMYAMVLASQTPSFLVDWNNNYGDDPDKCVCFHCSNFPRGCFDQCRMDAQDILADTVGRDSSYGPIKGRVKAGPMTYARVTTWDDEGIIGAYVGQGRFTDDPVETFGGYGVSEIPDLQSLLRYICENGFEHHVAMSYSQCAKAVYEAFDKYLGWDVYWHQG